MRLIIAGSRSMPEHIAMPYIRAHAAVLRPTVVICGKARGVDTWGENWARAEGIPVEPHPVLDWKRANGSTDFQAGHRRNGRMVVAAGPVGGLLCIYWAGSGGSLNCRAQALRAGLLVVSVEITLPSPFEAV